MRLMTDVRRSIAEGRFEEFRWEFGQTYRPADEAARREQKAKWLKAREG
jgi:queuine/archaeosine tRNA-ribosyltransferase